ncbi:hypothetical protein SNE40_006648 [Patella caerulea]|uniref:CARD domain-containing protein n=1 Tax=Patella caerulea TaxID=87958 RepID=A0AAN8Q1A7_PATCE
MATEDERSRGRMNDSDYDVIQRNTPYLREQLIGKDIVDIMFAKHIINRDQVVEVDKQMKKSRPEGIRVLLGFLMDSGGVNAMEPFIECLNDAGFKHVADKLKRDRQVTADAKYVD